MRKWQPPHFYAMQFSYNLLYFPVKILYRGSMSVRRAPCCGKRLRRGVFFCFVTENTKIKVFLKVKGRYKIN